MTQVSDNVALPAWYSCNLWNYTSNYLSSLINRKPSVSIFIRFQLLAGDCIWDSEIQWPSSIYKNLLNLETDICALDYSTAHFHFHQASSFFALNIKILEQPGGISSRLEGRRGLESSTFSMGVDTISCLEPGSTFISVTFLILTLF